jgi:hypothetical protein
MPVLLSNAAAAPSFEDARVTRDRSRSANARCRIFILQTGVSERGKKKKARSPTHEGSRDPAFMLGGFSFG